MIWGMIAGGIVLFLAGYALAAVMCSSGYSEKMQEAYELGMKVGASSVNVKNKVANKKSACCIKNH